MVDPFVIVDEPVDSIASEGIRRSVWIAEECEEIEDDEVRFVTYAAWGVVARSDEAIALPPLELSIMAICRTIYEEVRSVLYGENVFVFTYRSPLQLTPVTILATKFLSDRPSESRTLIKSIVLKTRVCNLELVTHAVHEADRVDEEEIDVPPWPNPNPSDSTKLLWKVLRDMPKLQSLRIRLDDDYIDIKEN